MISKTEAPYADLPACRADLVVRSLGEDEHFVVKDPRNGAYYQLGEEEHFLLMQLDGTRTADAVCANFAERFGQPLSPEELDEFAEKARSRGFLQDHSQSHGHDNAAANRGAESDSGGASQRRRQSILYWRKNFFDPDRVFTWLAPKLSFFWAPAFLIVSVGCVALAAVVFWSKRHEVAGSVAQALNWEMAVVTWLALAVVTTLHESAHGLTCKRYGGEVHEIGFLLIYLQPAFYCNVSDAWLFRDKSKRMWVTFAGAYFELFLWGLATLVWRVTDTSTWLNHLALVFLTVSGIATLFNLNPLIKLDGYYLLSDYLEIPNLRPRAFRYLAGCARRLLGSPEPRPEVTLREKRIFLRYGLLAWAFSVSLLGLTLIYFGRLLTGRYQAWGAALFAALLGYLLRSRLKRLCWRACAGLAPGTGLAPGVWLRRWTKRLLWLGLLGAGVTATFLVRMELRISGPFTVLPAQNAEVRAEVEGLINEICVEEGAAVRKGELIAQLSDRDYRAQFQQAKAETEEKQAKLRLLKAGSRPEEIELARTIIAKTDDRLRYAKSRLEMDTKLYESRLLSLREFQETEELVAVRQKELEEATEKLNVLLAGSRLEEIEAAEAEINRLQAQQRHLEEQLKLLWVVSPIEGVVTTHRLKERIGQHAQKGDLIAVVHELESVTAEIAVPEKEIADVKLGQPIVLKARAYPQERFEGTVTRIAPIASSAAVGQEEKRVLVTTRIKNASHLLKAEMTGNAKIYCGQRRVIDITTRRLVRFVRVEFWSWW